MKHGIQWCLLVFALSTASFGQNFDRLTIRPKWEGSAYTPGKIQWNASSGWPSTDPEFVTLRSPDTLTERYGLIWPGDPPRFTSCLGAVPSGQMYFLACGEGLLNLDPLSAIMLDDSTGEETCGWSRTAGGATGPDVFYNEIVCGVGDHVQWTFVVPDGFSTEPILNIWYESADDQDFIALVRCVAPNVGIWTAQNWDSANTVDTGGGIGGLALTQIPLENNDDMDPGDVCQIDLEYDAGSQAATSILWVTLE